MRALRRETVEDVATIRDVEIARIDAMLESIWPIALENPEWIRQYMDRKKIVPLVDEEGGRSSASSLPWRSSKPSLEC